MIPVRLLYFARLAELIGLTAEDLAVPAAIDDAGLLRLVAERHPAATGLLSRTRVAADQTFVRGPLPIRPGLEIALIPPVSGG